jgi:5'-3' exonuclease
VQPLYLVDASIYIFRAYFSLPEGWTSPEGYSQHAVYGYTGFLLDLLAQLDAAGGVSLACAFDESLGSCYRNQLYPGYKSSRELPDEALAYQLATCREITDRLGIPTFSGERFEADDYIASLAGCARDRGLPVCVVTRDKDLGQLLLGESDSWWDFAAGKRLQREDFRERFGILPEQFADYLALVGDPIDDIPGVPAIGAKTAARLLQAFADLEEIAYKLDELPDLGLRGAARIQANLREHWSVALMSRQLARLADRIDGVSLPAEYRLARGPLTGLVDYLDELGLRGGLARRCQGLLASL